MEAFSQPCQVKTVDCPDHGQFESKGMQIPFTGHWVWTQCPRCHSERLEREEAESRALAAAERQRRLEAAVSRAGIPIRFRNRTLDNFSVDIPEQEAALSIARRFADRLRNQSGGSTLVLSGGPGTGKTHIALGIANSIVPDRTVLYVSALDVVRMFKDCWNRSSNMTERQVLDTLGNVDLLIMDEVGVQYGTDAEKVMLFEVINRRYQDMASTIVITNLNKAGFKDFIGERAFDRLREGGIWVTFSWDSYRGRDRGAVL